LTDDGRRYTCHKQRPRQSDYAFASAEPPARRFVSREHCQVGFQIRLHQFPGFEQPVFVLIALRQRQVRVHRRVVVQDAVCSEVENDGLRGFSLGAIFAGLSAGINFASVRAIQLPQRFDLGFGFRQRTELAVAQRQCHALNRLLAQRRIPEREQSGRRRLAPLALALLAVVLLLAPWSASVGNYGALIAIPDQETIIRAPESASLVALRVRPGDQIAGGAVIGQMGNYDLEEQIVQAQSELARASADYDRLLGELRARQEAAIRADTQLRQRQRDYDEIETERRQIAERQQFEKSGARIVAASTPASYQFDQAAARYPAALAVLQSEVDSRRAELDEATAQRDRARKLNADGIAPRSELDATETRAATLASASVAARQRLEAALVEHRRKHTARRPR
jgi:hypothetical protein